VSRQDCQPGAAAPRPPAHMLSIDVEEYFQVEAAAAAVSRDDWSGFPKRLDRQVDRLLQLLADRHVAATFFILGWVARHEPAVVRRIADAGHEIASHGMDHQMLGQLGPERFRRDLADCRRLLSDLTGQPVVGYRAPTFSLTHRTAWALDVLAEAGFVYDSSVFPIHHDRYGVPEAPRFPHQAVGPGGGEILEVPPLTVRLMRVNWPLGGGGYLRLLPARLIAHGLRRAEREGWQGMIYLHPWELDPDQPVLPMSRPARWRHRVNLKRTSRKLAWLLGRFRFAPVSSTLVGFAPTLRRFTYGVSS